MKTYQKKRRLRKISEVINMIKKDDPETAVTKYMIRSFIKNNEVYHQRYGKLELVDVDETYERLGILYD